MPLRLPARPAPLRRRLRNRPLRLRARQARARLRGVFGQGLRRNRLPRRLRSPAARRLRLRGARGRARQPLHRTGGAGRPVASRAQPHLPGPAQRGALRRRRRRGRPLFRLRRLPARPDSLRPHGAHGRPAPDPRRPAPGRHRLPHPALLRLLRPRRGALARGGPGPLPPDRKRLHQIGQRAASHARRSVRRRARGRAEERPRHDHHRRHPRRRHRFRLHFYRRRHHERQARDRGERDHPHPGQRERERRAQPAGGPRPGGHPAEVDCRRRGHRLRARRDRQHRQLGDRNHLPRQRRPLPEPPGAQ